MIKFKQFKPPGVYLVDIQRFTGYHDVKGACAKAGVLLFRLRAKEYSPLSLEDTYRVLKVIRSLQGKRFLRQVSKSSKI